MSPARKRQNCVEGRFYPSNPEECRAELTNCIPAAAPQGRAFIAGIVPHAGWVFSGPTAGKVFAAIRAGASPETILIFGAAHRYSGKSPVVMSRGAWNTPIGDVEIDAPAAARLAEAFGGNLVDDPELHEGEHSIEVQAPFIKHVFPEAKIVPVIVPPSEEAVPFGEAAGTLLRGGAGKTVLIASADLTHYGYEYGFAPKGVGPEALEWVRNVNDKRIVDLCLRMDAESIVPESRAFMNTCGAGAVAACVAAARAAGRNGGTLLEYTTSHDVMPRGEPKMFVGYAGIVF